MLNLFLFVLSLSGSHTFAQNTDLVPSSSTEIATLRRNGSMLARALGANDPSRAKLAAAETAAIEEIRGNIAAGVRIPRPTPGSANAIPDDVVFAMIADRPFDFVSLVVRRFGADGGDVDSLWANPRVIAELESAERRQDVRARLRRGGNTASFFGSPRELSLANPETRQDPCGAQIFRSYYLETAVINDPTAREERIRALRMSDSLDCLIASIGPDLGSSSRIMMDRSSIIESTTFIPKRLPRPVQGEPAAPSSIETIGRERAE
jgi:hypothetical protein